jgi:polyhydroxybutyrate depolymerase
MRPPRMTHRCGLAAVSLCLVLGCEAADDAAIADAAPTPDARVDAAPTPAADAAPTPDADARPGPDAAHPDAAAPPTPDATAPDAVAPPDARVTPDAGPGPDAAPPASPGCGRPPVDAPGGVQLAADFGPEAAGERSYFLVLPANYDPAAPHRLIFGYAGTNWTGEQIRPYLDLEDPASTDIYVYPDVLWRDFEGWGNLGGWLLGPHARPADGNADLVFTAALLDRLQADYCIDPAQVFATGHSWGGDFAAVLGCFLGDRFRGVAPIAANRPYWFEPAGRRRPRLRRVRRRCGRSSARRTSHFTGQPYPGSYGDEQDTFWRAARHCGDAAGDVDLAIGAPGECVEHTSCDTPVRYCLYDPATGHQRPGYFPAEFRRWLDSF